MPPSLQCAERDPLPPGAVLHNAPPPPLESAPVRGPPTPDTPCPLRASPRCRAQLPRCISFAQMKAGMRNMRSRVSWHVFDLLDWGASPLAGRSGTYDVALDSCTLHSLDLESKLRYLKTAVQAALKPGGMVGFGVLRVWGFAGGRFLRIRGLGFSGFQAGHAGWANAGKRARVVRGSAGCGGGGVGWGGQGRAGQPTCRLVVPSCSPDAPSTGRRACVCRVSRACPHWVVLLG